MKIGGATCILGALYYSIIINNKMTYSEEDVLENTESVHR